MNISDEAKIDVLATMLDPLFAALAAAGVADDEQPPEVTADDILDFFAMGMAAVIENDSNLTTPGHIRQAVETTAKRISARVKYVRLYRELHGQSLLSAILDGSRAPRGAVN